MLPQEVNRKAQAAKDAIAAMNANAGTAPRSGEGSDETTNTAPSAPAEARVTVAPRETPVETRVAAPEAPAAGEEGQAPAEGPAVTAPPEDAQSEAGIDREDWQARYNLLRVSRDRRRAELETELAGVKRDLAEANRRIEQMAPPADDKSKGFTLSDEDRERLGDEQAEILERVAREQRAELEKGREADNARLARRQARFEDEMDALAPTWRELDRDDAFNAWLDAHDETLGVTRRSALDALVDDFDAPSVARLTNAYVASLRAAAGAHPSMPAPAGASPEPESHRGAPSTDEQLVEVYSAKEIKDHYAEKHALARTGKLKGAELERIKARETAIELAMREGRIQ